MKELGFATAKSISDYSCLQLKNQTTKSSIPLARENEPGATHLNVKTVGEDES
jgi:hypothetical protein